MHETVYAEFEKICRERAAGGAVLEIGAVPSDESLLCLEALSSAREKIGVSLDGPSRHAGFEILKANANDLACFENGRFDTALCNSVLEHDPRFWKTLVEIRRVAKPGALVVIGVPGYGPASASRPPWLVRKMARLPFLRGRIAPWLEGAQASTPTLVVHDFPGDYYRFSEQAVREVFLEGLVDVEVRTVMNPPRFIGVGRRADIAAR